MTHSLLHFVDHVEGSGDKNSDNYCDISASSVPTCHLTDFDKDSSDSDTDLSVLNQNVNWSCGSSSQWFGT